MIEFLRNILESVYRDPAFKARADEIFTKRVLELHLRKMPLFRDLDDAGLQADRPEHRAGQLRARRSWSATSTSAPTACTWCATGW